MKCGKCGAENKDRALFCAACGEPLEPASEPEAAAEPARRPSRVRTAVLTALAAVAVAAAAALTVLSAAPPAFTDEQALAALPAGAEILDRHERSGGREQQLDYRYTQQYGFCQAERTERTPFRYEKGAWSNAGEPQVLAETEDWSALTGCWTEQTEGPEGWFLRVQITGFDGGTLEGEVLYQDGVSSWEGPASEAFGPGQRAENGGTWVLKGTGFFRYNYLRIDRDAGVFFDNDAMPMVRTEHLTEPPVRELEEPDPAAESGPAETEKSWLVATADLNVRPGPNMDDEPLGTVAAGTALACTGPETEDGWYPVAYNGGAGYVFGGYTLALTADMTVGVATATADLNVRTGPGTDYERLDTVSAGTRMVYTALEEGWYRVIYSGQSAYVAGDYVLPEPVVLPEG